MRIDIFKLTTLLLALTSMLIPWFSPSLFLSDRANFTTNLSFDLSPSLTQVTLAHFQDNTLKISGSAPSYHLPLFPADLLFQTISAVTSDSAPVSGHLLAHLLRGVYGFSVCFVIVALFAMGTWKSAAKKVFLAALSVLIFGTVFSLAAQIWFYEMTLESWVIASRALATCFGNEEVFYVDSFVFNVGFFLAILSMLSLVLSYLSPKLVTLPVELDTKLLHELKEHWLAVPDRERLPAIFLTTFLVSSSLFLFTLLR
jgi:lysylphosphatidylglycerol synthetase-like protein (DUF2156 family)